MDEALRAVIRSALGAAVPVDWGQSAQGVPVPRVVLYRIGGSGDYTMAGPSGYRRARVQADCMGASVGSAKSLARQVVAALSGYRGGIFLGVFLDAERDLQPETDRAEPVGRVALDFIVHYKE